VAYVNRPGGKTSWHGFAEAIVKGGAARGLCNDVPIDPITTAEYPLPAKRPGNSVMSNEGLNHAYKLASRHWLGELNLSLDRLSAP
jgi:dTDP-4-dehydrorhamnose reductase